MTQMSKRNKILDRKFFENIIAYNAIHNAQYLSSIIDHWDADYFENDYIKIILPLAIDFFKQRNVSPSLTEIRALLSDDEQKSAFKSLLLSFKTMDSVYNEEELYANTEYFFRERAVYKAVQKSASKLANNELDVGEILPEFERACNISLVDDLGFNYLENIEKHCSDLIRKTETISTGIKWLDERIGGGFLREGRQLIVIVGRTNMGKSIVLGNVGLNLLKQNKKVLVISLEMPEILYAKRFSSQISGIPLSDLTQSVDSLKTTIMSFKNLNKDATLYIKEFPPKSVTVHHINAYIQKLKKKGHKFDAILVDYLNLIKPSSSDQNSYEGIKEISEQLRATSYLFNCPVITASQLNRKGMSAENPDMDSISESVGITFTADLQLSIWASEEDRIAGLMNMSIQKNRFGPVNDVTALGIDYQTLVIREIAHESDSQSALEGADAINDTLSRIDKIGSIGN